jgi:hypothetical protein
MSIVMTPIQRAAREILDTPKGDTKPHASNGQGAPAAFARHPQETEPKVEPKPAMRVTCSGLSRHSPSVISPVWRERHTRRHLVGVMDATFGHLREVTARTVRLPRPFISRRPEARFMPSSHRRSLIHAAP